MLHTLSNVCACERRGRPVFVGFLVSPAERDGEVSLGALIPSYASVETLEGLSLTPADEAYAPGCVAYRLLCGVHPCGRVSSVRAMETARTVPLVPGFGMRRNRVLKMSVEFLAKRCWKDVEGFSRAHRKGWPLWS
jgi:hypothetical protein